MGIALERQPLRQRADYTHKFNTKSGRHGWLRLTPAYSVKMVEELLTHHQQVKRIFDPFCGTGTTALSAAYHGHEVVTTDINPFLIWLAQAKLANYSEQEIVATHAAGRAALELVRREGVEPAPPPPIHNIERWWNTRAIDFLCLLRAAIFAVTAEHSAQRNLLLVAFCRSLIGLSNAAFNHQSMSFKTDKQLGLCFEVNLSEVFAEDLVFVLKGAAENPVGEAQVFHADARNLAEVLDEQFDVLITSPPYANRMSYIRELRPYMYWLGYLHNGRDAGELDWTAIGGTWGIATSRLTGWERSTAHFDSPLLAGILERIADADNKNGAVLAKYVAKYFDDMWLHFQSITSLLTLGAELHYIVGNSTFYNTLVPTEKLYKEMLLSLGFQNVECHEIRKRNSKKELIEFDVTAYWQK